MYKNSKVYRSSSFTDSGHCLITKSSVFTEKQYHHIVLTVCLFALLAAMLMLQNPQCHLYVNFYF